jgi:hypothetical protein
LLVILQKYTARRYLVSGSVTKIYTYVEQYGKETVGSVSFWRFHGSSIPGGNPPDFSAVFSVIFSRNRMGSLRKKFP